MTSEVCVDANVVIWSLIPSPLSEAAEKLFEKWQRDGFVLIAPALFAFEVTSTLRRLVFLKELTLDEGNEAFHKFLQLPIRLSYRRAIFPLSWQLAQKFNHSRTHDTSYLALAYLRGCDFWTADERLFNGTKEYFTWVKWLGNYRE